MNLVAVLYGSAGVPRKSSDHVIDVVSGVANSDIPWYNKHSRGSDLAIPETPEIGKGYASDFRELEMRVLASMVTSSRPPGYIGHMTITEATIEGPNADLHVKYRLDDGSEIRDIIKANPGGMYGTKKRRT